MAAKHYDDEGTGDYLTPAVKKEWLSALYSTGQLYTPGLGKCKTTSVPDAYYQTIGEGGQTLIAEELEHGAPGLSHSASHRPELDDY